MANTRKFVVVLEIEVSNEEIDGTWTEDGVSDMITNILGYEKGVVDIEIIKIKEKNAKDENDENTDENE